MMTSIRFTAFLGVIAALLLSPSSRAQQPSTHEHGASPGAAQQTQTDQHCEMTKRGDQAMGFSQQKTTHHFYLAKDGGVIEVGTNDPKDAVSREQIRQHLTHIAHLFADGNFDAPMFIHATTPPGVPTMARLHDQIRYEFQESEAGGRVRITTTSTQALDAIHAFLLFQILDHQTGDSAVISDGPTKN